MWSLTMQDLLYRRRRFVIAIAGTALVFGMALIMAGMSAGFRAEADRTLDAVGAETWIVPAGVAGPFTAFSAIGASDAARLARSPGLRRSAPVVVLRQTIEHEGPLDVTMIGAAAGRGLGEAPVVAGRRPAASKEAVVDASIGLGLGERFELQAQTFTVVGLTDGVTAFGGIPAVFVRLADAQRIAFGTGNLVTAVVADGLPRRTPRGFVALSRTQARADLLRPLAKGVQAIDSVQVLCWIVAATIVGAVIYLSALERVRDFAVLKAIGASTRRLFGSLVLQAVVIALTAAAVGAGIALLLGPTFALPIQIPLRSFAVLPGLALAVGGVASLSGLRRSVAVDPAQAFGSA